jgi:DNA-binding NtrC family response regulator
MKQNEKKILIIDDDEELRDNLVEILTDSGYYTETACNGAEALQKITSGFDVVLLDYMMPGMNGLEVLAELNKISPAKVIMITAFATTDNAVSATKSGASDYVSKPFMIDNLLVTIKRVLEEARFEKNLLKFDMDFTLSSLTNPIRRNIIRLLHTHGKMRLMEFTRELGISDHTKVIFHLKSLKGSHIICHSKDKSYSLSEEGSKLFDCLAILECHIHSD